MLTDEPYYSEDIDDKHEAQRFLFNTCQFRNTEKAVKLEQKKYLEISNRKREYMLAQKFPLQMESAYLFEGESSKLQNIIQKRSSIRSFSHDKISWTDVSTLIYLSAGVRATESNGTLFRHYPSAGGLYPIEVFFAAQKINNLPDGIYHFCPFTNAVTKIREANKIPLIQQALLGGLPWIADCHLSILFTADTDKTMWKYGSRGLRYLFLDAGHLAQNFTLCAEALSLGSTAIGGFYENEINEILGLSSPDETVLYALAIGKPGNIVTKTMDVF